MRELTKRGLELIKKHEGWRSEPYLDVAGIPTIGYGFTWYPDSGMPVSMDDKPISKKEGERLLKIIVRKFEFEVDELVSSCLKPNQFDALVSFTYNVGVGAFLNSTLLKRVNKDPNDPDIDRQFQRWNKAGGRVWSGLVKRREEESWLYFEHKR
ncbi:MAG: lysozyme [Bacteroidota bacterium]